MNVPVGMARCRRLGCQRVMLLSTHFRCTGRLSGRGTEQVVVKLNGGDTGTAAQGQRPCLVRVLRAGPVLARPVAVCDGQQRGSVLLGCAGA